MLHGVTSLDFVLIVCLNLLVVVVYSYIVFVEFQSSCLRVVCNVFQIENMLVSVVG